jgi:glucose-6-phosphate 1-dehydrogenase
MKPEAGSVIHPFDLVIFGGSGDLTMRKLLPSLYYHHCDGLLAPAGRIIGVARSAMTRSDFVAMARENARRNIVSDAFDETHWAAFAERLDYLSMDISQPQEFQSLYDKLSHYPEHCRIYYLSTAPVLFAPICEQLGRLGLAAGNARVAVEKPLGRDLASAREINQQIGAVFDESQIFRIDHYLGKEPVQNLLALRFGNALFEPLWNRAHISAVQITIAEQLGIEGRGEFYDQTGALRDMLQNHLLQLLCIIAMEPPIHNTADAVRDEKLKVLRALRPLTGATALRDSIRAQYRGGAVNGQLVAAYTDEKGVAADSVTETYVALRAGIDNWRWHGVPFFLRTGKRLQERVTEIVIHFEPLPHAIFPTTERATAPNRLVIRLQPEEYIRLSIRAKAPGDEMILRPVELNLDLTQAHRERQRSAYERLLIDLLRNHQTLFLRHDELEAAWSWVDPILAAWAASDESPVQYTAGSWGPSAASRLIYQHGSHWPEES